MQREIRRRRSVLYVPASNTKAIAKVATLECDTVIYDLEDAVAPQEKAAAREILMQVFAAGTCPRASKERVIRINAEAGLPVAEDIDVAGRCRPHAVLLPKVESTRMLLEARRALDDLGGGSVRLWAMVETPRGIVDLRDILRGADETQVGLDALVVGTNDLAKETGVPLVEGRATLEQWTGSIVLLARAFCLDVIDGVYNDLNNDAGLEDECQRGLLRGFDGKTLIHPRQISAANKAFSPSEEAVREAREIIAAFERPENVGKGVLLVNGKMTERLHAEMARQVLAKAQG